MKGKIVETPSDSDFVREIKKKKKRTTNQSETSTSKKYKKGVRVSTQNSDFFNITLCIFVFSKCVFV